MKTSVIIVAVIGIAIVTLVAGFWLGFRPGWQMGLMTEAAPRGVVGMQLGRRIDVVGADEAKYYFESQIDAGLMFWHDVSESRLSPYLNTLTGTEVYPEYEKYIRRLAQYRKANPSPLWDPATGAEVDATVAGHDAELAKDIAEASRDAKKAMDEVVSNYAP